MLRANYGLGTYTPEEDVTETLEDGRTIQIALKGHPIPMADAIRAGLVKEGKTQGPAEKKPAQGPTEVKASVADEDEDGDEADEDNVDAADTNPPPTPPAPAPAPAPAPKSNNK